MTPAAGEYRFASAAARRLASLGAILFGSRNAVGAGSVLQEYDIDHLPGAHALREFIQQMIGTRAPATHTVNGRSQLLHPVPDVRRSRPWPWPSADAYGLLPFDSGLYASVVGFVRAGQVAKGLRSVQVPEHLECPMTLNASFDQYDNKTRRFFNCARVWCCQVSILTGNCGYSGLLHDLHGGIKAGDMDKVKEPLRRFMNRIMCLNVQQQHIIFQCAASFVS